MTFEEFKSNVEVWAEARGIYEHSTALAQALKACSEAGELCDAIIKKDRDSMIDAVGDVAVCLVNAWHMHVPESKMSYRHTKHKSLTSSVCAGHAVIFCGEAVEALGSSWPRNAKRALDRALQSLEMFCFSEDLDFMSCCAAAWNEIKDRKGRMVPGGAFVKEGEA